VSFRTGLRVIVRDGYGATDAILAEFTGEFNVLTWTTRVHGGFGICSVAVPMDLPSIWEWLRREDRVGRHFAHLTVLEDQDVRYEGRLMDVWYDPGAPTLALHLEAAGYWNSCRDQYYDAADSGNTNWRAGSNHFADEIIKEMLTDECPDVSTDQSNIESPALELAGIDLRDRAYPQDVIVSRIPHTSDGTDQWYFAIWENRIAYYSARSIANVHWTTKRSEFATGGRIGQNAYDMRNTITPVDSGTEGTETNDSATRPARYPKRELLVAVQTGLPSGAENNEASRALAERKEPHQSQSFVIAGSIWRTYNSGERFEAPLWRVRAGDVIRVDDLLPFSAASPALDNLRTFFIIETRYDALRGILSVTPDRNANRLSSILARTIAVEPGR
jgi:hypothetical protein